VYIVVYPEYNIDSFYWYYVYIVVSPDYNIDRLLPVEPVNVVVWGDKNIHILPLPVNVVVWGDNNIHILPL
jgi:hypothetical protein